MEAEDLAVLGDSWIEHHKWILRCCRCNCQMKANVDARFLAFCFSEYSNEQDILPANEWYKTSRNPRIKVSYTLTILLLMWYIRAINIWLLSLVTQTFRKSMSMFFSCNKRHGTWMGIYSYLTGIGLVRAVQLCHNSHVRFRLHCSRPDILLHSQACSSCVVPLIHKLICPIPFSISVTFKPEPRFIKLASIWHTAGSTRAPFFSPQVVITMNCKVLPPLPDSTLLKLTFDTYHLLYLLLLPLSTDVSSLNQEQDIAWYKVWDEEVPGAGLFFPLYSTPASFKKYLLIPCLKTQEISV